MSRSYLAKISVVLKDSVLDPQGQAVTGAFHNLKHNEVEGVRIGKYIEVKFSAPDSDKANQQVASYCDTLLSNPVIENYKFELTEL